MHGAANVGNEAQGEEGWCYTCQDPHYVSGYLVVEGVWQLRKPDVVIRIPWQSGTLKCAGVFSEGGQLALWGLPLVAFSRACSGATGMRDPKGQRPRFG